MGKGSRFTIHLSGRIAEPDMDVKPMKGNITKQVKSHMNEKSILIVDDNEINMKLIVAMLEGKGYNLLSAACGQDAVNIAFENHIDLILMDIQLPDFDGITAMNKIKKKNGNKTPKFIAYTANAMKGDREKFLSDGFDDYIAKPIEINSLLGKIEKNITQD